MGDQILKNFKFTCSLKSLTLIGKYSHSSIIIDLVATRLSAVRPFVSYFTIASSLRRFA